MARTKKATREELQARIEGLQPYELLAALRHVQYDGSPLKPANRPPIIKRETIEAHGGRYDVTVTYWGHWRMDTGVVEVVAWPLRDDDTRGDSPMVEVHGGLWAADATKVFRAWQHDAVYTAPWAHMVRWVLSDGVRLANAASDAKDTKDAAPVTPTRQTDAERIAAAIALFPAAFDMRGSEGTFRLSPTASYINDHDTVILYTQRLMGDGVWADYAKGPIAEMKAEITGSRIPYRLHQVSREGEWVSPDVFVARDAREINQAVIAGFLGGQARWAVEDGTGRFLFGLNARGKTIAAVPTADRDRCYAVTH